MQRKKRPGFPRTTGNIWAEAGRALAETAGKPDTPADNSSSPHLSRGQDLSACFVRCVDLASTGKVEEKAPPMLNCAYVSVSVQLFSPQRPPLWPSPA